MRAARIHAYGTADQLRIEDAPEPILRAGDVRVEVHAAGVNPVDYKLRQGIQRLVVRRTFPQILGMDVSGVVTEVAGDVDRFQVGDAVYGSPSHKRDGCYAEQVVINADELALKPASLSHVEAASIPLVGLTCWQALVRHGRLAAGHRVFIQGGSGGIGTFAIQLARARGAQVVTTCSAANHDLVRELGAHDVIDYREVDFATVIAPGLDVGLDTFGGDHTLRMLPLMRRGGRLANLSSGMPTYVPRYGAALGTAWTFARMGGLVGWASARYGVSLRPIVRPAKGELLEMITGLIDAGSIKAIVDKTFPLDDVAEAHRYIETGRAKGKVVLELRS